MIYRILALIYKEFLAVWRDKKSRLVLILPPFTQLLIFSFAATLDVQNVSIGILNQDSGEKAFELVMRFSGSKTFSHITHLQSVDEIASYIDNKNGVMVLHIDEQFSRNLDAGKPAKVQIILDGRKSNSAQIVAGYTSQIIDSFTRDLEAKSGALKQPAALVIRNWFNPNLEYTWFTVPSLTGILTMLEALIITALSVARERELGTFDQLLVSPLRPIEILIGKAVPAIVIAMIAGTLIIQVAIHLFKIPFTGSFLALYWSMLIYVTSIVGVGLFISSLCSTQQQAILGSFVFMSPSIMLSGFATPIENMPTWLQPITYLMPLRYFLVIAKGSFLKAMPQDIIFENTWPMILIALFTLSSARWLFRHRLG